MFTKNVNSRINFRPYFKSKLELNLKKSNSSNTKIFFIFFDIFFFELKAELQVLKFECCQVKLS